MAGFEANTANTQCKCCGEIYSRMKGYFPVSYAPLYKATGHLPYCRKCIDQMYDAYYNECGDMKKAVRQMCRKMDIYFSDTLFNAIVSVCTPRTIMTNYLVKAAGSKSTGKCYDDTLRDEDALWLEPSDYLKIHGQRDDVNLVENINTSSTKKETAPEEDASNTPEDVIAFWGPGYTDSMYTELEQRLQFYKAKMPDVEMDVGTEALLRQIVMSEIDINKARAEGKPVDKMVGSLNTLLGSAMLKPAQKKDDADDATLKTPLGVWIKRWEDYRPTPEIDPDLKDVDKIGRCVSSWFLGHLCKMLGIKNTYSKLYEEDIARYKVERPEFEDEDDEAVVYDIFGDKNNGSEDEE